MERGRILSMKIQYTSFSTNSKVLIYVKQSDHLSPVTVVVHKRKRYTKVDKIDKLECSWTPSWSKLQ